jgi:adenylate cyclase class 2
LAIETEIKVRLTDPVAFRRLLHGLEHSSVSERHFEDNYLLDFPDGRMNSLSSLVRVRLTESRSWLTYKGPPQAGGVFKTREELETPVEDGAVALQILQNLGMQIWFRYQKYRQEYDLRVPGNPLERVHLALDQTPVGSFAEFEGSEEGIRATAAAMGLSESGFIRTSYYTLYREYCSERGESPGHMVFPEGPSAANQPI